MKNNVKFYCFNVGIIILNGQSSISFNDLKLDSLLSTNSKRAPTLLFYLLDILISMLRMKYKRTES